MNYDKMPRQELIQELEAWQEKFDDKLEQVEAAKIKSLNDENIITIKKLNDKNAKVININNKSLKKCLNELLEFEKKGQHIFSNEIAFKNVYLYIKCKVSGIYEKRFTQRLDDIFKVEDAIRLILDRVSEK